MVTVGVSFWNNFGISEVRCELLHPIWDLPDLTSELGKVFQLSRQVVSSVAHLGQIFDNCSGYVKFRMCISSLAPSGGPLRI
jgi:hypothetical protein